MRRNTEQKTDVKCYKQMLSALKVIRTWAACGRAMGFHEKDEALDDIVKLCDRTLKPEQEKKDGTEMDR